MNKIEKKMVDLLKKMRDGGVVGTKAEFEAEGTRTEELLRLLEITRKAELSIGLKIGGCEAVRDLIEAKQIGVNYIIAPMVESSYALSKFIDAKNRVYNSEEREDTDFLINIETQQAFSDIDNIIAIASKKNGIDGIVFGRVDYALSKNLDINLTDANEVIDDCIDVAKRCKTKNLDLVVGGGVCSDSIRSLKKIEKFHLSRFETRKVIFSKIALRSSKIENLLLNAVHFEILWLLNKRNFYTVITNEDNARIKMLNKRWNII